MVDHRCCSSGALRAASAAASASASTPDRAAAAAMAAHGAPVKRVMTDNAFAYRLSRDFQNALTQLGAKHILIKPRQYTFCMHIAY